MHKRWMIYTLCLLVLMFFGVSQVLASSVDVDLDKKPPEKTPGAQATERAIERAADQASGEHGKSKPKGNPVNIKGKLVSATAGSMEIELTDGSTITIVLNDQTSIQIPTLGKGATFENLVPGVMVGVHARMNDENQLVAQRVTVVPGKPTKIHRVGFITEYLAGTSITIQAKDGNQYTFLLLESTKILPASRIADLKLGAWVTIICPRDVTGGKPTARGIVIHPKYTPPTATATITQTPTSTPTPTATATETPTSTPTSPAPVGP